MRRPQRLIVVGRCLLAGVTIAAAIPPWGWWPLVFLGIAQWDRLVADQPWNRRFARTWVVAVTWLLLTMLWMWDLTNPGYIIACVSYAAMFGATVSLVPPRSPARWLAMPAAIVLGELWRWSWPFGGVPLGTLAQSLADSPFAQGARLTNALSISGLAAIGGVAFSAAAARKWRPAAIGALIVIALTGLGAVAPRGSVIEPLRVAAVQGGGPQRTRAASSDSAEVFARHLEASKLIEGEVDLVIWPENVVSIDGLLEGSVEDRALTKLATDLDATLIVGITEDGGPESFFNASVVYSPDGSLGDRYDKVRRVPFGEFVPVRPLLEAVAGNAGLPARDAVIGTGPAVVDTGHGPVGIVISWEVFFSDRGADAASHGAETIANPTNGSSYWLTQVQTQQVASSRLRAIETGRWLVQAAPTGFSAIVDSNGHIIDCTQHRPDGVTGEALTTTGWCRSDVGEQVVLQATIDRRSGNTLAVTVGIWPTVIASLLAIAGAQWMARRTAEPPLVA